jgi:hypothetical protein
MGPHMHRQPSPPLSPAADHDSRLPLWIQVISAASVFAGLVLLVAVAYYSCLNINPPRPRPGDLYFGDGTGFVIAAFAACPAAAALAAGFLVPWLAARSQGRYPIDRRARARERLGLPRSARSCRDAGGRG